jgi:hypothetical protein
MSCPLAPIGGDDRYPIVGLANAQMEINHQRVDHTGGNGFDDFLTG